MPMNLRQYFTLRSGNTLDAERNIDAFFSDVLRKVQHDQVKSILQQHRDAIRTEIKHLKTIIERLGGETEQEAIRAAGTVIIVGRGWVGEYGGEVIEEHKSFARRIPKYLVDINALLVAEDVAHFNLGNYTGLIVLAKQLDEQEIAQMLQVNIDLETNIRTQVEGSLSQWIGMLASEQQQQKAA